MKFVDKTNNVVKDTFHKNNSLSLSDFLTSSHVQTLHKSKTDKLTMEYINTRVSSIVQTITSS